MCLVKIILLCGFILLNITVFLNATSEKFSDNIQVLIKDGAKKDDGVVFTGVELQNASFPTFLSSANVVIDRSMFIEYVVKTFIKNNDAFIITSPSRWGKTTLQSMLGFFFGIQLHDNLKLMDRSKTNAFQYFHKGQINVNGILHKFDKKPLLFQKTTIKAELNKHLANHPIITIDFVNVYKRGLSAEDFKINLKIQIWSQYIVYKKKLDAICSRKEKLDIVDLCYYREQVIKYQLDPGRALNILTRLLYIAYEGRKIVLLLDEYDTVILEDYIPANEPIIPKKVLEIDPKVEMVYKDFMMEFLKEPSGSDTMYLFIYITGIMPISFDGATATVTRYRNYLSPGLTPFFGINNNTANELMSKAKFNKTTKDEIASVCGHYETPNSPEVTTYNPYSLLQFLQKTEDKHRWHKKSLTRFLSYGILPRNKNAAKNLMRFIAGECIAYSYDKTRSFTFPDLSMLQEHILYWYNNPIEEMFLTYLLNVGILTLSTIDKDENGPWTLQTVNKQIRSCVKIPNRENRLIIQEELSIRTINEVDVIRTSEILANILSDPKLSLKNFEERVQLFMAHPNNTENLIHSSELFYHGLFFSDIVRYLGKRYNYSYFLDYKLMNLKDKKTPDIVIVNNSYGAVFEIKYNNKPTQIKDAKQGQLRKYGLLFHKAYPKIENLRLILIHVEENEKCTITVKVTGLDPITSEKDFIKLQEDFNSYNTNKSKQNTLDIAKKEVEDQTQILNSEI